MLCTASDVPVIVNFALYRYTQLSICRVNKNIHVCAALVSFLFNYMSFVSVQFCRIKRFDMLICCTPVHRLISDVK